MFVAFGMTKEAAKTAIVIAKEEQSKGQYKLARDLLLAMYTVNFIQIYFCPSENHLAGMR